MADIETKESQRLENDTEMQIDEQPNAVSSEEALLESLSNQNDKERQKREATVTDFPQAKEDAPTLLKAVIGKKDGDSEEEKKIEQDEGNADNEEVEKKEEKRENQFAQRANQLDFLLSKASEYSNFIASDLEQLQMSMQKKAEMDATPGKKKRKRKRDSTSSKKSKKNDGHKNLSETISKHNEKQGNKAIFTPPASLAEGCVLKDYQLEGVRWMASLFENGVSGILADEMGLGKTIQVIALVAHLMTMGVNGPFIVIAPLATLPNWVREFNKWLPKVAVIRYHGTGADRNKMLKGPLHYTKRRNKDFPVIITSYEMAIMDQTKLNKIGEFTYLVVDEGQRLKNHRCILIQSLKKIAASNRLLLSGTPIQNNLDELWSLLNFVNPQIFDDLSVFQSWFGFRDIGQTQKLNHTTEDQIMEEQKKNSTVSKLHEILRPFLLRRIKKDVLLDMPPKKEVIVYAGMSKLQSGYAALIEKGQLKEALIAQNIENAHRLSMKSRLMSNRKNSNHPFLFGEPIDINTGLHLGTAYPHLLIRASGKFALLDRLLTKLFEDKHQVLIFSQMTHVLSIIEDYLVYKNWKYCRIDGTTDIDERQRQMDVFNAEKTNGVDGTRNDTDERFFVFLLSTRAGGLGINLASADTCIIFDSDWNPHQDSQAMDRCHRIGQTRPVAVYRLLTTGTVDIDMMEKQMSKKKLERMAIVGGDFRKAGKRHKRDFNTQVLSALLEDDIKDLQAKASDVEDIKISEEELDNILDRKKLFAEGDDAIPMEGKMYDIVDTQNVEVLGAMNA